MVDPVNNANTNVLIRAQQAAAINAKQTQPATITQARSAAIVPVKASAVPQTFKLAGTSEKPLPRGSIVDRLV